jgi:hypothetical protein
VNEKIKLSLRVRPNCEAAPWVIEEIKLMEQDFERLLAASRIAYNTLAELPFYPKGQDELHDAIKNTERKSNDND